MVLSLLNLISHFVGSVYNAHLWLLLLHIMSILQKFLFIKFSGIMHVHIEFMQYVMVETS